MAISRWQFVCKNDACQYKDHGFVILSPWPLGKIEDIINSSRVQRIPDFKKVLEERKDKGVKYSCIQYPNSDNIRVVGYRVHLWCNKCLKLSEFDVLISEEDAQRITDNKCPANDDDIVKNAIERANLPSNCPVCNEKFKTYLEMIDMKYGPVFCPSCKTAIPIPKVWFANEE